MTISQGSHFTARFGDIDGLKTGGTSGAQATLFGRVGCYALDVILTFGKLYLFNLVHEDDRRTLLTNITDHLNPSFWQHTWSA